VKIYLDVSCLNRPFDDQSQSRVRLESEAVTIILDECEQGTWEHVSSEMATVEIAAMPDADRRARVLLLLPPAKELLKLNEELFARAEELKSLGFKAADAVHVAAAEAMSANVLLTCDDRLIRVARRRRSDLKVRVLNPLDWLGETGRAIDA
jgi:predicted nucleic acid-binding protein